MNRTILIGRLTSKPELRYTSSNVPVSKFTIAVNRRPKENGTREADFINCIVWKTTAETITKYFDKGSQIGIEGRIQTGSYDDKDGKKVYTTDVIVESITFLENKRESTNIEKPQIDEDPFVDFGTMIGQEQVNIDDSFLD